LGGGGGNVLFIVRKESFPDLEIKSNIIHNE
jgi:hypothetical protein